MRRRVITPIDAPEQIQEEARVQRRERETVKTSALLRALGLAHYWQRLLDEGKYRSLTEIAGLEGIDLAQASRTAQLCELAPALIETCLAVGSPTYRLEKMSRRRPPRCWKKQLDDLQPTAT